MGTWAATACFGLASWRRNAHTLEVASHNLMKPTFFMCNPNEHEWSGRIVDQAEKYSAVYKKHVGLKLCNVPLTTPARGSSAVP